LLLRTLALILLASVAFAEERTYSLTVDGKPAGQAIVTVEAGKDGVTTLRSQVDFTVPPARYAATETWKAGRLAKLESGRVTLTPGTDGYTLKAGVKEVAVRGEVWPSSSWRMPEAEKPLVVDVETGEVRRPKIEKLGPDRLTLNGKPIASTHYRLTAGGQVGELWYDEKNLLLRRTWTTEAKKAVLELTALK
jgi:hypothetical protein